MEPKPYVPLANVMDLLLDAICVVDVEGRCQFVSAAFERIFGYAPAEVIGRSMIELVHPDDRERTLQAAAEIMAGQPKLHFENRYVRKDGQVVHVLWSARWSEADQVRIAVAHDITEIKVAQSVQSALFAISEAANAEGDLQTLFRRIHDIVGGLLPARNLFVALYDEDKDELTFPYYVDECDTAPAPCRLDSGTLSAEVIRSGQALLLTPDHELPPVAAARSHQSIGKASLDWLGVPLRSSKGVIGALVVQTYAGDVRYTERDKVLLQFVSTQIASAIVRKQTDTWLQYIALHDPLTDLPNREMFHDRMRAALAAARHDGLQLALLYIDLDGFKQVNDGYGHPVGDLLLQAVSQRIRHCVRESDTVGRIGGDEFVVLLHGVARPGDAATVAEAIRSSLGQPFDLAGHRLQISCSIGIAIHPQHGDDNRQLIRHADEAMYAAKKSGGDRLLLAD